MICLLSVFLSDFSLLAQSKILVDSIQNVLNNKNLSDSLKVHCWNALAYEYRAANQDSNKFYLDKALKLATEQNILTEKADAIGLLAGHYRRKGIYTFAFSYVFESVAICEKIGDWNGAGQGYIDLGVLYNDTQDNEKSLFYYQKALQIYRKINNPRNLANVLNNMGNSLVRSKKYKEALNALFESKQIAENIKNQIRMANVYGDLGTLYTKFENTDSLKKGITYFLNAVNICQKIDNNYLKTTTLNDLGNTYFLLKEYPKSLFYYEQATNLAKKIGYAHRLYSSYEGLSKVYSIQKNYEQAYKFYQLFINLRDSILNDKNQQLIKGAQFQYEINQKDLELEKERSASLILKGEKESQNILIFSVLGALLTAIFIAIWFFRNQQRQREINALLSVKNDEILEKNELLEIQTYKLETNNLKIKQKNEEIQNIAENLKEQKEELESTLLNLKHAQTKLVQVEKMAGIGTLTAGIAHEINNPINFVKNNIEAVDANLKDILSVVEKYDRLNAENITEELPKIQKFKKQIDFQIAIEEMEVLVKGIRDGANRTAAIVKGLRTFSRLDEDGIKKVDMHENIDSTLMLLQNQYKERIEIIKNYGNIPQIECFAGKINQVLMNLLANAVQAIEDKGRITITSECIENAILIKIRDSGKGIPLHLKERIFEPFFTTKDVGKGTGLGLSISAGIVEQHKGMLSFESEIGKGTEFFLRLPVLQTTN